MQLKSVSNGKIPLMLGSLAVFSIFALTKISRTSSRIPSLSSAGAYRVQEKLFFYEYLANKTAGLREIGQEQRCPKMSSSVLNAQQQLLKEGAGHHYGKIYDLIAKIASAAHLDTVIETGTFHGDGTDALSKWAKKVYTIELDHALHHKAKKRFAAKRNIVLKNGNSAEMIADIIGELDGHPALFFLDGHWSAGETALGDASVGGETPILAELEHILSSTAMARSAIVVDDARMFKGFDDPACVGGITCYPSVKDLGQIICASSYGDMVYLYIMHDQIIVVGDKALMRDALAVWHYDAEALLVVIAADYLRKPALQNLDDSAFFTAAVVYARHASEHLVAVEQCLHLTCAKEQVLRAIFRNEEAEAVFIALDTPFDKLHARRQAIHATSITNQLPITAHRDQPAPKRLDLLVADKAQSPAQGLVI